MRELTAWRERAYRNGVYCCMRTLLSRATQVDPSFNVGLGLILILAVAEIFAATSYYIGRSRAARTAQAVATSVAQPVVPPVATPAMARPTAQAAPSPEAILQTPAPSLVDQLLREGTELRNRGDTTDALARFEEALDSEPSNVTVLEEIAKTYDSMQVYDKSNEVWRKLHDMGPSAGEAYELAEQRLKVGVPTSATADSSTANASLGAASHRDVAGKPEGPVMGITEVKAAETPDPDAETNLALRIGIKKQPGATIDHTKVKILVEFYDTVGDKDVKLTDADVNYEWLTPRHDWAAAEPEVLSVTYLRPKIGVGSPEASLSEAAATVRPGQKNRGSKSSASDTAKRKYLGYRIRIYYDDKLQAVQAEPSRLLQLFPAAETSSAQ
jgi:tetratricopeptide (TPR) repeat protein